MGEGLRGLEYSLSLLRNGLGREECKGRDFHQHRDKWTGMARSGPIYYTGNCFHQNTVADKQSGKVLCFDCILYSHSQISRMSLNAPFESGKD